MTEPARSLAARKADTLHRLENDVDCWVATAAADGTPYLMPLSFLWTGETLILSTNRRNPTARNLLANGRVQIALGELRDVVHIVATAREFTPTKEIADAFAAKAGFDPRKSNYPYFAATPTRIQAWREVNELETRDLMHQGHWLI